MTQAAVQPGLVARKVVLKTSLITGAAHVARQFRCREAGQHAESNRHG